MTQFKYTRVSLVAIVLSVVALGLVATGCSAGDEATKVEAQIHDDIVAAYGEGKQLLSEAESAISAESKTAWSTAKADFEALEADLDKAKDLTGTEATRAYRDIQHELDRLDQEAHTILHSARDEVTTDAESAWHDMVAAYLAVRNRIDHAIDDLHS